MRLSYPPAELLQKQPFSVYVAVIQSVFALCRTLYWTDYSPSHPAIYRSSVVNASRETLVSENLVWPNALAVDFTGKQAAIP